MKTKNLFAILIAVFATFGLVACDSPEEKLENSFTEFHDSFSDLIEDPSGDNLSNAKEKYVDFLGQAQDYNSYYQAERAARKAEKEAEKLVASAGEGEGAWWNPTTWF